MSGPLGSKSAGKYRTVAFQAIGVAVIAAFIFLTFLRADEPGVLSKIDAPGSSGGPIVVNPDAPGKKGSGNDGDQDPGEGAPREGSAPSGGLDDLGDIGDSGTQIPEGDAPPTTGGNEGVDPPGAQYDDLVTRLMEDVGGASLYRKIDP